MDPNSTMKRHRWHRNMIALILIAVLAGCAPFAAKPAPPAYWPTKGWQSTTPEEQGIDSELLAQMAEHIRKENLNLHSLLIVRNSYLVNELYVYPYSSAQSHRVMSVTKSVIATLVGIAIEQGYIKDVHQTLLSLLPDQEVANLDEQKKAITLENLLTQTSGLDCPDIPAEGEPFMESSEDWVQFMLDRPMETQPGKAFHYCTGSTHLISAILHKATGMSAREFANRELFGPLGIETVQEDRWPSDPQGVSIGGYGLSLTPQEMAKIGYLYFNQGEWDGETILPLEWVVSSMSSHANQGDKKEYGYLWWVDPQKEWYAALGLAGQHIFVFPAENLVVVFTSDLPYTNDADLTPLQKLLNQYILPAVKSDHPLPANAMGQAHLEAELKALAQPQLTDPPPLSATASQISGKTYILEDNPFGWHNIIFTFEEGADEAKVTIDGMRQMSIGLDNVYRLFSLNNNPFPEAFRGHWEDQNTFVVEDLVLGQSPKTISRVQFSRDALLIDWEEKSSGTKVVLKGTMEPVSQ